MRCGETRRITSGVLWHSGIIVIDTSWCAISELTTWRSLNVCNIKKCVWEVLVPLVSLIWSLECCTVSCLGTITIVSIKKPYPCFKDQVCSAFEASSSSIDFCRLWATLISASACLNYTVILFYGIEDCVKAAPDQHMLSMLTLLIHVRGLNVMFYVNSKWYLCLAPF